MVAPGYLRADGYTKILDKLTPETQFNGMPLIVYFAQTVAFIINMHYIYVDLRSSVRNSPIIQVDKGPPAIGWHHLKNE